MLPIHTILHPTDFSQYSVYAFQLHARGRVFESLGSSSGAAWFCTSCRRRI